MAFYFGPFGFSIFKDTLAVHKHYCFIQILAEKASLNSIIARFLVINNGQNSGPITPNN